MSEPQTICALYSRGPHYLRLLRYLRAQYPAAHITALVPASFPGDAARAYAQEIVRCEDGPRSGLGALHSLSGQIRRGRYDLFVVMFDSPKLRVLAALSGARQRACYAINGRFFPVRLALFSQLAGTLVRRIKGRILYARIHYIVHNKPVQKS